MGSGLADLSLTSPTIILDALYLVRGQKASCGVIDQCQRVADWQALDDDCLLSSLSSKLADPILA